MSDTARSSPPLKPVRSLPDDEAQSEIDKSDFIAVGSLETSNDENVREHIVLQPESEAVRRDDLTLLEGIDGPQAIELQSLGFHSFAQLHDLAEADRTKLQEHFRQRGWSLDMEQWRIASEGNTLRPSIEDIQRKAFEIYEDRERRGFGGGERTDWEQAEWELRGNPIFSYGVPHQIDDFAHSLMGITAKARDELYRMGLYNHEQIRALDPEQRKLLTGWFAGPRFSVDMTHAFEDLA